MLKRSPSPDDKLKDAPVTAAELAEFKDRGALERRIQLAAKYAYLGSNRGLVRTLSRYKLFVATEDQTIAPHLIMEGFWEIWNTAAFCRLVKPGMSVLEVGAHLGYFSTLLCDLIGPDGRYVGFEPNSRLEGLLRESLDINGFTPRARVMKMAAAREPGVRTLRAPGRMYGGASIIHTGPTPPDWFEENVDAVRLDVWCMENGFRPDFIKIDAEGAEPEILDGLRRVLESSGPLTLVFEFDAARYANWRTMLNTIADYGFALKRIGFDSHLQDIDLFDVTFEPGDLFEICAVRE